MAKNRLDSFFTNIILLGVLLVLVYFLFTKYMGGKIDLDKLVDKSGKITIPKFPGDTKVVKPSPAEKKTVIENRPPVVEAPKKVELPAEPKPKPKPKREIESNIKPEKKPAPKKVEVEEEVTALPETTVVTQKMIQNDIGGLKGNRLFEVHAAVPQEGGWGTQVAAYKQYDNAIRHASVLKKYDFNQVYIYVSPKDTVQAYKVILGNFTYKEDAMTHKGLLKDIHNIEGFIVHIHTNH